MDESVHRDLTEAQMERFQVFRTGPNAKMRHLDCAAAWLVDRLNLSQVIDQAMAHQQCCTSSGLASTELRGQEPLFDPDGREVRLDEIERQQ